MLWIFSTFFIKTILTQTGTSNMDHQRAWQTVLGQLQMEMPRASYDTWVRDTKALSYKKGCLTIGVRNTYARDWLESRLASTVSRLLIGIMNRTVTVDFVISQPNFVDDNFDDDDDKDDGEYVDVSEHEIEQVQENPQKDSPTITAISLEDHKLMDRVVVLSGYMQRLVQDIGVKGVWLYAAHKQAFFMAGSGEKQGEVTRRVKSDEIIRWSIFSNGAYWRNLKRQLPVMGGLLECIGNGEVRTQAYRREGRTLRRRLANEYRLYLTPRLVRADAAFLFQSLKGTKSIEAGLKRLVRMSRKNLIDLLPSLGSKKSNVDGVENMNFVVDIVRALTGEEGELPEPLTELSNKLHLKIIKLWGTIHLSHYFLYRLVPDRSLTAHQAWLLAVARDRAYINSRTGEMRSEIKFSSYEEMATLCGMASWKGVATWLRPYENKRGGNLSSFMQEIDSPDDKSFGKIGEMERRFWVQLDDEELPPAESNGSFGESDGNLLEESNGSLAVESNGSFGESNGSLPEESNGSFGTDAYIYVLKENTINTKKSKHLKPPTTRSSQENSEAGSGGADISSWDMRLLLKLNSGGRKETRKRILSEGNPVALVSWLLYAYSPSGKGIQTHALFALSKLRENPCEVEPGIYGKIAKLGPVKLREKLQKQLRGELDMVERFFEGQNDTSGWSKTFGGVSDEIIQELASHLFVGGLDF
jgi:hypothetical protein